MNTRAKLQHFLSQPDADDVEANARQNFDYDLPHPLPEYPVKCRRCKAVGHKPDGDMQLSRFHYKQNRNKQFPNWIDQMYKCTQCSNVESVGLIPFNHEGHMRVIEKHGSYVVEWRDVRDENKKAIEQKEVTDERRP